MFFNKIVSFYNSKKSSERILLMCTVYMAIFCWAFVILKNNKALDSKMVSMQGKIAEIKTVLNLKEVILADLEAVKKNIDSTKTIKSDDLQIITEECAKNAGLTYDISGITPSSFNNFKLFSLALTFQRADIPSLIEFEKQLMEYAPYIIVNNATVSSASRGYVSAKYQISSFLIE